MEDSFLKSFQCPFIPHLSRLWLSLLHALPVISEPVDISSTPVTVSFRPVAVFTNNRLASSEDANAGRKEVCPELRASFQEGLLSINYFNSHFISLPLPLLGYTHLTIKPDSSSQSGILAEKPRPIPRRQVAK